MLAVVVEELVVDVSVLVVDVTVVVTVVGGGSGMTTHPIHSHEKNSRTISIEPPTMIRTIVSKLILLRCSVATDTNASFASHVRSLYS